VNGLESRSDDDSRCYGRYDSRCYVSNGDQNKLPRRK
jgi:hypothetical protein